MQLLFSIRSSVAGFCIRVLGFVCGNAQYLQHVVLLLSHNRLLYGNVIVCLSANELFMRHVFVIKIASIQALLHFHRGISLFSLDFILFYFDFFLSQASSMKSICRWQLLIFPNIVFIHNECKHFSDDDILYSQKAPSDWHHYCNICHIRAHPLKAFHLGLYQQCFNKTSHFCMQFDCCCCCLIRCKWW